jgi:hypothetical protein
MLTRRRIPVKIGVIGRCEPIGPAQLGSSHASEVARPSSDEGEENALSDRPPFLRRAIAVAGR